MPRIAPYRDRANPQQGSVPELDTERGRLFVGSADEHVYCLDAQTGRVIWRRDLGAAVRGQPLFQRSTQVIFVGTDNGELFALGADDGEERWSFRAEGEIIHQPLIVGEALYTSCADGTVLAIDWTNGNEIWRYNHDGASAEFEVSGFAGVAVDDGVVFTGFSYGIVVALDAFDGSEVWSRDVTEGLSLHSRIGGMPVMKDVDTTPVLGSRRLYVASYEAGIFALDREGGSVLWRDPTPNVVELAGRGTTLYAAQASEGVLALDTSDGSVIWRTDLGPATYYRPALFNDVLVVPDNQLGLTALRLRDGSIVQRYPIGAGVGGSTELVGSVAFVVSNGGVLSALRLR